MRTLVFGDIHGSLRGLEQCLERCEFSYEEDKIIFLGDYVDGWSESAELIQYLIDLQEESTQEHIFIRGNHDVWCAEWLFSGIAKTMWIEQGGRATRDSYIRTNYLIEDSHKDFFRQLKNYYVDDQNRAFVHGGFKSRKGLGHEVYQSDYYWDRDLWNLAFFTHNQQEEVEDEGVPQGKRHLKHEEIYIGHTSTIYWKHKMHYPETTDSNLVGTPIMVPMNRCNVWNMDTGAGYTGKLTVMDIDTKEYWQSAQSHLLYPDESGR